MTKVKMLLMAKSLNVNLNYLKEEVLEKSYFSVLPKKTTNMEVPLLINLIIAI